MNDACNDGVAIPGCSWSKLAPPSITGWNSWTAGAYDPTHNQWLLAATDSAGASFRAVYPSAGFGDADYSTNVSSSITTNGVIHSVLFDGTHYFAAHVDTSGHLTIFRSSPAGAWTAVYVDSATVYQDAALVIFKGNIVLIGLNAPLIYSLYSPVGSGGVGAWTARRRV